MSFEDSLFSLTHYIYTYIHYLSKRYPNPNQIYIIFYLFFWYQSFLLPYKTCT